MIDTELLSSDEEWSRMAYYLDEGLAGLSYHDFRWALFMHNYERQRARDRVAARERNASLPELNWPWTKKSGPIDPANSKLVGGGSSGSSSENTSSEHHAATKS